jgi:hypothetical protein
MLRSIELTQRTALPGAERTFRSRATAARSPEPRTHTQDIPQVGQQGQDDLVYAARLSLDQRQLKAGDRVVDVGPGMAVTVGMKTGSAA